MYSLVLDSSTKVLYVCLVCDDKILGEYYIKGKNDHAKNIVNCIDNLLKKENIETKDLNRVIVGYGPGSYTGVRMAVTVAKMIAVFQRIPLYSISTLKLMASGYKEVVKVMIDARRNNAFACVYDVNNNQFLLKEGLYSYEELNKYDANFICNEEDFKVNPFYCIKYANIVKEPHLLVPNYLRETEAERNHHDS